jgi:colanic acid biosynthesis glycosyl transferase WcaI
VRVLVLTEEYPSSDAAFVFSHAADVAAELIARGHHVTVLTTTRGMSGSTPRGATSDPRLDVRRLPMTWFGRMVPLRIAAAVSYFLQITTRILFGRRPDVLLVLTAPPMVGPVAAMSATVRRLPIVFWAMDLNPEQLAALRTLSSDGMAYRLLAACMKWFVSRCSRIIALDEAMARRLTAKGVASAALVVVPPWADDRHIHKEGLDTGRFRARWGVSGSRILLYSGNLSPSNPVAALLKGFESLPATHDLALVFMGDGGLHDEVRRACQRNPGRIALVPREPAGDFAAALAAADIHVATMGPDLSGILHPSKVYSALAAGRPVLFVGAEESPSAHLLHEEGVGWVVPHDPVRVGELLRQLASLPSAELNAMGVRCRRLSETRFSQAALTHEVANCIEAAGTQRLSGNALRTAATTR